MSAFTFFAIEPTTKVKEMLLSTGQGQKKKRKKRRKKWKDGRMSVF